MTKLQWGVIIGGVSLLTAMYFAKTKSEKGSDNPKTAAIGLDIEALKTSAKNNLSALILKTTDSLEQVIAKSTSDTEKTIALKALSSVWNQTGSFVLGGNYAEKVAEIMPSDSSWAITGTTYMLAFKQAQEPEIKEFATKKAIQSFEKALSLNPKNVSHKINLALCYVDGTGEPMKGIAMLTELSQKDSTNPTVFLTLGKLAMRTAQWEKAIKRFEKVVSLRPEEADGYCLVAQAYQESGNSIKAKEAYLNCSKFTDNPTIKQEVKEILSTIK